MPPLKFRLTAFLGTQWKRLWLGQALISKSKIFTDKNLQSNFPYKLFWTWEKNGLSNFPPKSVTSGADCRPNFKLRSRQSRLWTIVFYEFVICFLLLCFQRNVAYIFQTQIGVIWCSNDFPYIVALPKVRLYFNWAHSFQASSSWSRWAQI